MDVFCVGMYRSGSTWQYEVVSHLVEKHRRGRRLGFLKGEEYAGLERAAAGDWRVLKAHEPHPSFAAALAEERACVIYSFRDLRDVTYSLLHKFHEPFHELVELNDRLHVCLANDAYWTAQPGSLWQRYEEIVTAPTAAVAELAAAVGVRLDEGEAEAVAEEYSLAANRRRSAELTERLRQQGLELDAQANAYRYDERTLLHWNHIREGRIGGWREEATLREVAVLAGICGPWLIARGYERDATWALPAQAHFPSELGAARRALAETRMELARRQQELEEMRRMGPMALGIARRVHQMAVRHPWLSGAVRRLLGPRARNAST